MQQLDGLRPDQVTQVRGFADQRLRNLKDPFDSSNRRISIIVQYLSSNADEANSADKDGKESEPAKPSPEGAKVETDASAK
jgi:chemotaxis protein MotB